MEKGNRGFTLIELLIVIGIVGILGAAAWPYYQGHVIRARLSEVENAIGTVKSAVSTYYHDTDGLWPTCATVNEIRNSLGIGLMSIGRISGMSIQNNGVITATVQNIDPLVDNKTLSLIPSAGPVSDGSVRWIWGWSADFPVHLRPRSN